VWPGSLVVSWRQTDVRWLPSDQAAANSGAKFGNNRIIAPQYPASDSSRVQEAVEAAGQMAPLGHRLRALCRV
jgi:hypothetical protein